MKRREFITLFGGAAVWPFTARAQQSVMPVVGYLDGANAGAREKVVAAFRQGLNESGFVEGQNVSIVLRFADTHYDRLPALVADLIQRQVSVIVGSGIPAAVAAKTATTTIPIVFYAGGDAVAAGLAASLNRPGGNLTGVVNLNVELGPKRLEILHEVVPTATVIALLVNPGNPNAEIVQRDTAAAARAFGLELHILYAKNDQEIDEAFNSMQQVRARALLVGPDNFFVSRTDQLAVLTLRHAMPAILLYREFAAAGGLMSYGGSITDGYRLTGIYTARVLNGEKPADLPILQSTKVELVINLKTAKALGLSIPLALLGRADEVIE
jgi:putative tryptophan/tyrosine transport system substrate-binding protein